MKIYTLVLFGICQLAISTELHGQTNNGFDSQKDNPTQVISSSTCVSSVKTNENALYKQGKELFLIEKNKKYKVDKRFVTVKEKDEYSAKAASNYKPLRENKLGYSIIEVPQGREIEDFVEKLIESGYYSCVEYNSIWEPLFYPNDTYSGNQWHIGNILLNNAWNITKGNPNNILAIIDSGIDLGHNDLYYGSDSYSNVINGGWDYAYHMSYTSPTFPHGTQVAGVVCAKTNNNYGIAGVSGGDNSPGIRVFSYSIYDPQYGYLSAYLPDAIIDAVNDSAKIINISLSGPPTQAIINALDYAYNNGVSVVCSAGNDADSSLSFPASYYNTIAVGAYNTSSQRANFSNYGSGLDLVAPGVNIYTTTLNNTYTFNDGTSFSSPIVASTIALMLSVNPTLTPDEIRNILHLSSRKYYLYPYDSTGWNQEIGYGLLDAEKAVAMAPISIMNIIGPDSLCGSEVFSVENIPSSFVVNWTFKSGNNSDLIQEDYPVTQQCIINIENNENINDTLVATIKFNGNTITQLEKAVRTNWKFVGTISQEGNNTYSPIPPTVFYNGAIKNVWPGCLITITSPHFKNVVLSHTTSQYMTWQYDNDETITVLFSSLLLNPLTITVNGTSLTDCNNFTFKLRCIRRVPLDPLFSVSDNSLRVVLNNEAADCTIEEGVLWNIQIKNIKTGIVVYENNYQEKCISINTSKWQQGIYSVKMKLGPDEVTKKIMLNK